MSEPKLLTKEELNTRLMILGTSHPAAKEVILHIAAQEKIIENLQAQNSDYEESFKMRCRADERAIKRWEKESPHERKLKMPDHVDLVIWLGEQLENLEARFNTALLANADWERWAQQVCNDFKIPFDDHTAALRLAIVGWMYYRQHVKPLSGGKEKT